MREVRDAGEGGGGLAAEGGAETVLETAATNKKYAWRHPVTRWYAIEIVRHL